MSLEKLLNLPEPKSTHVKKNCDFNTYIIFLLRGLSEVKYAKLLEQCPAHGKCGKYATTLSWRWESEVVKKMDFVAH